jgi:hypothetical protein
MEQGPMVVVEKQGDVWDFVRGILHQDMQILIFLDMAVEEDSDVVSEGGIKKYYFF